MSLFILENAQIVAQQSEMWKEYKGSPSYWVPSGSHLLFIKIDYFPINIYLSLHH